MESIKYVFEEVENMINHDRISKLVSELRVGEGLERTNILQAIIYLIDVNHESVNHYERYRRCCMAQDYVWEKLNTGHWKEVWHGWRDLYAIVALLRLDCVLKILLGQQTISKDNCDKTMKKPSNSASSAPAILSPAAPVTLSPAAPVTLSPAAQVRQSSLNTAERLIIEDLVRMADLGLLLGGPVLDHSLERIAKTLTHYLSKEVLPMKYPRPSEDAFEIDKVCVNLPAECHPLQLVKTVTEPSIEDFVSDFKLPEIPVVIKGCLTDWPASSGPRAWSVDRLVRAAGPRTVPVEIGSNYTHHEWTQKLMTIREFASNYLCEDAKELGYLAQHQLLDQVPELAEDIEIPDYCFAGEEEDVDINVWIGPKGTVSPLHTDPKHNLLSQVVGTKYVVLYPAEATPNLYPHPSPLLFNTSQLDLQKPDLNKFPKFSCCRGWHTLLRPGEMLYIPPRTWHFVKGLSTSFSVSFWWQ